MKIEPDFDSPILSERLVVPYRLRFYDFAHPRLLFLSSVVSFLAFIGVSQDSAAVICSL